MKLQILQGSGTPAITFSTSLQPELCFPVATSFSSFSNPDEFHILPFHNLSIFIINKLLVMGHEKQTQLCIITSPNFFAPLFLFQP
jgi:hypothetical protein